MPYLKIETNLDLAAPRQSELLSAASSRVAAMLGKPESYVMVALDAGKPMLFGGSDQPLAYLELKSIGLPRDRTTELSAQLTELMQQLLDLKPDRVYIEFADAERPMWGWNGGTF